MVLSSGDSNALLRQWHISRIKTRKLAAIAEGMNTYIDIMRPIAHCSYHGNSTIELTSVHYTGKCLLTLGVKYDDRAPVMAT